MVLMFTQRATMKFWPCKSDSYVEDLAIHFTNLCDIMHLISEKVREEVPTRQNKQCIYLTLASSPELILLSKRNGQLMFT